MSQNRGVEKRSITVYPSASKFRRNQGVFNQATGRVEHIAEPGFSPLGTRAYTTGESGTAFSEDTFVPLSGIIPALFKNIIPFLAESVNRGR